MLLLTYNSVKYVTLYINVHNPEIGDLQQIFKRNG